MATTKLSSKMLKARTHARRRSASARQAAGTGGEPPAGQYATGSNAPTTGELQLEVSIGRRVRLLRQRLQLTATELAAEAGLDERRVAAVLASSDHAADLASDEAAARELGIAATPYLVVDHRLGLGGPASIEDYLELIDKGLREGA